MRHNAVVVVGVIVMIALIVGLDIAFLRNHFLLRLITNVGIVAVFAALYLIVRKHL